VDEDLMSPEMGRLIDAAKAAARDSAGGAASEPGTSGARTGGTPVRSEGWALLGRHGAIFAGPGLGEALAAAAEVDGQARAGSGITAAAFAVAGESGDTLLPRSGWCPARNDIDPELPVAVKYLGRWVVVTLAEIPGR
jgi:hypothetical protein